MLHFQTGGAWVLPLCFIVCVSGCSESNVFDASEQTQAPGTDVRSPGRVVLATTYHVSTSGNDSTGDGSASRPWRTLKYAATRATWGDTLTLSAGVFVELGPIDIPPGVNVIGMGKDQTVIKAHSSFFYNPPSPGYALDKYLIRLASSSVVDGSQRLKGFKVDGDGRQLHGGIYVNRRNHVTLEQVEVTGTHFNAIWLLNGTDMVVRDVRLINTAWASTSWVAGALHVINLERALIERLYIDEDTGYGIKTLGVGGPGVKMHDIVIRDSRISVSPDGIWNGGLANISIEFWNVDIARCEVANSYVDNFISVVSDDANAVPTGVPVLRIHDNVIDLGTRANGVGMGVEVSVDDVEIDHNFFIRGAYGIVNWGPYRRSNWFIHHNVFYNLEGYWPGDIVRSQNAGLRNLRFYNNTIEFDNDKTMHVIGMHGGSSENLDIANNIAIDSRPGEYNHYPKVFLRLETGNGATVSQLSVRNNLLYNLPMGSVPGSYQANLFTNPKVVATGSRPEPYYHLMAVSPAINTGVNVGFPYSGAAPDMGAYEYVSTNLPSEKLALTPTMVVQESGAGDARMLVDEQALSGDPRSGTGGRPTQAWITGTRSAMPANAYIDLGREMELTDVYLFDTNGNDTTRNDEWVVSVGTPGQWTVVATESCDRYLVWKRHPVAVRTRYVRLTNRVAYVRMSEVVLYGREVAPQP